MLILSGSISKKRHTKEFLNNLLSIDRNQLKKLYNDLERKMDEKGNLLGQILDCVNSFSEENPDLINKVGGIVGSYEGQVMLLHKKKGS